jgi:hypothetical protein
MRNSGGKESGDDQAIEDGEPREETLNRRDRCETELRKATEGLGMMAGALKRGVDSATRPRIARTAEAELMPRLGRFENEDANRWLLRARG